VMLRMTKAWGLWEVFVDPASRSVDGRRPDERRRGRLRTWGNPQYIWATYTQQPAAIFRNGAEAPARIAGSHWSAGSSRVQH
jgi:hypothetical protein